MTEERLAEVVRLLEAIPGWHVGSVSDSAKAIKEAVAEIARLRALVQAAYVEGWKDCEGYSYAVTADQSWNSSSTKKQLDT